MNGLTVRIVMICTLIIPFILLQLPKIHAETSPPQVSAHAAAMIDVNSGRILYEKNADEEKSIASITKIMTAIIAIEHGDLEDRVSISANAAGMEGSSVYLRAGEKMKLHHLLYGLMLRSGNDTAVAIAEHIGGSVPGFAMLMNEKARYLGMTHTHFVNPHGLDDEEHYSSARDMAVLTAYALQNDTFQEIVASKVAQVPNPSEKWDHKWYNKNKMLQMYAGADGVKTGYTSRAHRTLVSSATRGGQQLVTVTLNASDDWNDSIALLNYGFSRYKERVIVEENETIDHPSMNDRDGQKLTIGPEYAFTYPLSEEEQATLHKQVNIAEELPSELTTGKRVGEISISLEDKPIGTVPLITKSRQTGADYSNVWQIWSELISPVWSETAQ